MQLTFKWDEKKAKENFNKHKVSFEEAKTVFNDPFSITKPDPLHSKGEHRYIDIGLSSRERILMVVYVERGSVIRIISSRRATRSERRIYEESSL